MKEVLKVFQSSFKGIFGGFQKVSGYGGLESFLREFQRNFKEGFQKDSKGVWGRYKGASGKCEGCSKSVSWLILKSFKDLSKGLS